MFHNCVSLSNNTLITKGFELEDNQLMKIYNDFKNLALDAGFTFEQWWNTVLRFIKNEFDCDAASWAIAGSCAYDALIEERMI